LRHQLKIVCPASSPVTLIARLSSKSCNCVRT
jgi:hypothetical protein